jgi:membrane-associated phospholipid phosphatase
MSCEAPPLPERSTVSRPLARVLLLWLGALAAMAALVAASYRWFDRPLAYFVHAHLAHGHFGILDVLTLMPDPLILAAIALLVFEAYRILRRLPLTMHHRIASACGLSILVAEAIKDQLKFVFGRAWPTSGSHHRPSLIGDGSYGFHWLHGGRPYDAFPSGHMGAACALLSVLWVCYPRGRPLWAAAALGVAAALVAGNYHFLGDVIAGAFVGCSVGLATARILRDWIFNKA